MGSDRSGAAARLGRARRVRVVLLLVVGVLAAQFFRLQVLRSHEYTLRSQENRLRAVSVPAPRGAIYDRHGRIIAENVPGYSVSILPGPRDTVRATLDRLAPYLGLDSAEKEIILERYGSRPKRPVLVSNDLGFRAVSAIEERRPAFRRAIVDMRPRRRYPAGPAVAHLVGYTGEISARQLGRPEYGDYRPGRIVGQAGVERRYEGRLAGEPGVRYLEVNAAGSIVRRLGPEPRVEPTPGRDLTLAVDFDLQRFAHRTFPEGRRGGAIALDPRTGEVLAFYSHPSFDPNAFVGGISEARWRRLESDPNRPLLNRVSGATYSPGSTFKLPVATIGMAGNEVSIGTHMRSPCTGRYRFGNRVFRCWKPGGHGDLDLAGAIQQSCNVYFYQLGLRIGVEALTRGATRLGFARPTGLDLPGEVSGHFPPSPDWYDRRYGRYGWTEAVALNLAIGQGENQQSLVRMALFYSALATGKRPFVPHLARDPGSPTPRVDWELGISEAERRDLVSAMGQVVNGARGTAYPYRLEDWRLAGKTGTAQNPHGEPHSWFVGFAPMHDPQIVVATLVAHGHPDNTTSLAVPYAAGLVRRHLDARYSGRRGETADPGGRPGGTDGASPGPAGGPAGGEGRR